MQYNCDYVTVIHDVKSSVFVILEATIGKYHELLGLTRNSAPLWESNPPLF